MSYDCNNTSDQIAIANSHAISETTFNNYLNNFWGEAAGGVSPEIKIWSELSTAMGEKNCEEECWKLTFDYEDTVTNSITFGFQEMEDGVPPPYEAGIAYYSIGMIKGVHEDMDALNYCFYKAKDSEDNYTVIIKAIADGGATTKYYDLSDLYP
ncbi:MAG: hypothetical protein JST82_08100 [Bacteroidetes bacterium]|nr:hypothetical protein [Bacteroidota bacterium]